jgi:streptogramin lyase
MNRRYIVFSILIGIVPVLALLWTASRASADLTSSHETALNPSGKAFEVNPDAGGNLWISDYFAQEIWQLDPGTNVYTIYQGMHGASDARRDGKGDVWWTNYIDNHLGRISLNTSQVTTWTLPGAGIPLGTAVDDSGNIWVTDSFEPLVHRFEPDTRQLCTYLVPDAGISDYIVAHGGYIWLGDWWLSRLLRLDPTTDEFTIWELPEGAFPEGVAVDESGHVWAADSELSVLVELQPEINRLTTHMLPAGIWPEMLVPHKGLVWYTEDYSGTVGVLDPATANGTTTTVTSTTESVTPACNNLGPGTSAPLVTSTGSASWASTALTTVLDSDGWTIYALEQGSSPWGIAVVQDDLFVVDEGRQKLLRLSVKGTEEKHRLYLPLVLK